jgi:ABC-type transport system involved in multi-copper enzyme maturation permease subunit
LRWLFAKELRELAASRATWLMAVCIGPLVGHAFMTAVVTYADVSGSGGGAAALSQGISPLDGLLVPTFGAYALLSTLLLPFVAIRLVSAEKESGALDLLLQGPTSLPWMLAVKSAAMLLFWMLSWVPGLVALLLWVSYGGHLHGAEVALLLGGHLLRGLVVIAVAFAAAAITESAASAAVVTLGLTLGSWALDFVAQVQGGLAQSLARFTPESTLRLFEQGELSAAVIMVAIAVSLTLLALATIWLHLGRAPRRSTALTGVVVLVGATVIALASELRVSRDVSEDRRNSFAQEDEQALRAIHGPITVTAHLAPEDPRLTDLERSVLHKLDRLVDVRLTTTARTGTGLFERPAAGYGEVWYAWRDQRRMTRSTTVPIVLETLYDLTGVRPPTNRAPDAYPGYPLVTTPRAAAVLFYLVWPLLMVVLYVGRRQLPRARAARIRASRSGASASATSQFGAPRSD